MSNKTTIMSAFGTVALDGESPRRQALERAITETEQRLARLSVEIDAATRASLWLTPEQTESRRLVTWRRDKLRALRESLENLEHDAKGLEELLVIRAGQLKEAAVAKSETLQGLRVDVENLRERIISLRSARTETPKPAEK